MTAPPLSDPSADPGKRPADNRRWRLLGTGGGSIRVTGQEIGPYERVEVVPVAEHDRIKEAARQLLGAAMVEEDLTPYLNALEDACGFGQQGQAPVDDTAGRWNHAAAFTVLREAVLRIRNRELDGRTVAEALDDALSESNRAGGRQ
jgi:hypothetical protein